MNLRTRPAPAAPSLLYRVDWVDVKGHHTDRDLTWVEASAEWWRLGHIVGKYEVRITPQGGAG